MTQNTIEVIPSVEETVKCILQCLNGKQFSLHNEMVLHQQISQAFQSMPGIQHEYDLDAKSIVDFYYAGVAIEVKIKGNKKDIYKQCKRYCGHEQVRALVLITNLTMGFPKELNTKPCYIFALAQAWL